MDADGRSPLSTLLWVDEQYHADDSLPACLGDSFLVALNPLFGGVRRHVLDLGVRFTDDSDDPVVRRYRIAPLTALAPLLAEGIVPYTGDVDVLRAIASSPDGVAVDAHDVRMFFETHTALHESAHLIADRTLDGHPVLSSDLEHLGPVLRALLAEAMANSVETIGILHADHGTHALLWAWNSLKALADPGRAALAAVAARAGMPELFAMSLWVYFHQNVVAETNAIGQHFLASCAREALAATDLEGPERRVLVNTCASVLELNPTARAVTTPAYFELNGMRAEFDEVTRLDFDDEDVIAATGLAGSIAALVEAARPWLTPPADS